MKHPKDPVLIELRGGTKRGNLKKTAEAADLHPSHLSKIEVGAIKNPRNPTVLRLAKTLKTDPEKLHNYFQGKAGKTIAEQTRLPLEGIDLGPQTLEGDLLIGLLLRGLLSSQKEKELYRLAATS